ncbi:MAG: hypothetical protein GX845_04790 [Erysipelothrix sp.]|nr:hypothetical protein [Erysipelothrix sp.]
MSLIIELIKDYINYIMYAVIAAAAGFAYYFGIWFLKKYVSQFKKVNWFYPVIPLLLVNGVFLVVAFQRYASNKILFFEGLAYFAMTLSVTIIYSVLAIAYVANQNRPYKVKRIAEKKQTTK